MNATAHPSVRVKMRYAAADKPAGIFYALSHGESTCSFEEHETEVVNARGLLDSFSLETNGAILHKHQSDVRDFTDEKEINEVYVPEVKKLVQTLTGATRVIVFHKVGRFEQGEKEGKRQPAANAHIDYTEESFRIWAKQELGDGPDAEKLLGKRWAAINVWRGIKAVERMPLAFVDGRTIDPEKLRHVPIHDRPGVPTPLVGMNLLHDPAQRWYYVPDMQPDEVLVFTLFDSDANRTQRVAHSAINDPTSRPDAAPRSSFEVRTIAFFD
ncbi:methyltransferase [Pseudomonas sp. UL073]|uniref:Methyltransferase n=1 Tax=Zestomonas insulae TaxID=2809017 RepID=A0ABS2IFE7_9GAMM|nr:CmcJ/NvfI family oxidoreductase [Pseudomonas insulae]MBM7061034.1 methyltransferase [Pseudomonas insulae]